MNDLLSFAPVNIMHEVICNLISSKFHIYITLIKLVPNFENVLCPMSLHKYGHQDGHGLFITFVDAVMKLYEP